MLLSSRDPLVIEKHLAMAAAAGAGVIAVSWYVPAVHYSRIPSIFLFWACDCLIAFYLHSKSMPPRYPPGQADEHGPPSDGIIPLLLERALPHKVTICIHVEPYEGRSAESLHKHLKYVQETYGSHPSYHKMRRGSRNLPVFYIYDSYRYIKHELIANFMT